MPHGFGSQSESLSEHARRGGRDTDLIGDYRDEITGNAAMHETSVEIIPLGSGHGHEEPPVCTRIEGVRA